MGKHHPPTKVGGFQFGDCKRRQFSHKETMFLNNVVYDHVIFLKDGTEVKIELMEVSPSKALVKVSL